MQKQGLLPTQQENNPLLGSQKDDIAAYAEGQRSAAYAERQQSAAYAAGEAKSADV